MGKALAMELMYRIEKETNDVVELICKSCGKTNGKWNFCWTGNDEGDLNGPFCSVECKDKNKLS